MNDNEYIAATKVMEWLNSKHPIPVDGGIDWAWAVKVMNVVGCPKDGENKVSLSWYVNNFLRRVAADIKEALNLPVMQVDLSLRHKTAVSPNDVMFANKLYEYLSAYRNALEDRITLNYITLGAKKGEHWIEILKRKYRSGWNDKEPTELKIEQTKEEATQDNTLRVTIQNIGE